MIFANITQQKEMRPFVLPNLFPSSFNKQNFIIVAVLNCSVHYTSSEWIGRLIWNAVGNILLRSAIHLRGSRPCCRLRRRLCDFRRFLALSLQSFVCVRYLLLSRLITTLFIKTVAKISFDIQLKFFEKQTLIARTQMRYQMNTNPSNGFPFVGLFKFKSMKGKYSWIYKWTT